MEINSKQAAYSHSIAYAIFIVSVFCISISFYFAEWNPMFDPVVTGMKEEQMGCYEWLFTSDILFTGMFATLLSQLFLTIRDYLKKTICCKAFSLSLALIITYTASFMIIYGISRETIIPNRWQFPFTWLLVSIYSFVLDFTIYKTKFWNKNTSGDTRKRRLKKYYPSKANKPKHRTIFTIIDSYSLTIFMILTMACPLVILGRFLMNRYPFFDLFMIQGDNTMIAICASQFVLDIVFTGFFSIFARRCAQIFDDIILDETNLNFQSGLTSGFARNFVLSVLGIYLFLALFLAIYIFILGPISIAKPFWWFAAYCFVCALMLDFFASCAFQKICTRSK